MSPKRKKIQKKNNLDRAIKTMTPRAKKWAEELVKSVSTLDLDARGKDIIFMWILEILLAYTPYPNKIITLTLANIISDISSGQAYGFLDWSEREKLID